MANKSAVTPCLLVLEQIFMELFRRRDMFIEVKPLKPKGSCLESRSLTTSIDA